MKELFTSAIVKLTLSYMAIIMTLSLTFSIVIYQISISEITDRLGIYEDRYGQTLPTDITYSTLNDTFRQTQLQEAKINLYAGLFYTDLIILVTGGLGSYLLARRTLQPIRYAHEAQARFSSDASHELRTPLAIMKSELEAALRDPHLKKIELRELLQSNLEEVNRLSDLSTTLLKLSSTSNSSAVLHRYDLNDIISRVIHSKTIASKRLTLNISKDLTVLVDKTLFEEVILIVLDNAQRYSTPKSNILINAKRLRELTVITVTNDGRGISKSDLPMIFNRFYKVDASRMKSSAGGYGLGLSLAKQLMDAQGGTIYITSVVNERTTVSITVKS